MKKLIIIVVLAVVLLLSFAAVAQAAYNGPVSTYLYTTTCGANNHVVVHWYSVSYLGRTFAPIMGNRTPLIPTQH